MYACVEPCLKAPKKEKQCSVYGTFFDDPLRGVSFFVKMGGVFDNTMNKIQDNPIYMCSTLFESSKRKEGNEI